MTRRQADLNNLPAIPTIQDNIELPVPPRVFQATLDYVAVHLHMPPKTESGLVLPGTQANPYRSPTGTVISVGPKVEGVKDGDIVIFHPHSIGPDLFWDKKQYVVLKAEGILGVMVEPALSEYKKELEARLKAGG